MKTSSPVMPDAPLFVQSYDFVRWVLKGSAVRDVAPPLRDTILREADELLSAITLALKRFDTPVEAARADALTVLLRVHLRLAHDLEQIPTQQYEHASRILDEIGRQLGGWRKRLEQVK